MNPPRTRKREISSPTTSQKKIKSLISQNQNDAEKVERVHYIKTHATGGYCGNEYEIKLSGLIWLNLKYDDDVKDFLLATNVAAVRPLDDICFKITWKDETRKPVMVFIQLKHKINVKNSKIELYEMFTAYKEIKRKMSGEKDDRLFRNKFDDCECYSILYTNNNFTLKTDPVTDNHYWSKLSEIIGTGGSVRKLSETGNEVNIKNVREEIEDWNENEFNAFVKSLLVFTSQADEMGVEDILTGHIEKHLRAYKNPFALERHPVTLMFIRMFVNWWKEVEDPFCFTKKDELLENAFKAFIKNPSMCALNILYKSKINDCYEFTDDAVTSLNLQDQHSSTVITTENSALTVVKVLQHLDNRDHVVLDLDYIASCKMNIGNRKALCEELKSKEDYIVILVCDEIPENETFKDIGEVVRKLRRILISNNNESIQKLKEFFLACEGEDHKEVHDEKCRLTDISETSQLDILQTAKVMFQDKKVYLADIVDDESKKYVKGDVLHKIVCGNAIAVGKLIVKCNKFESKHFWADRRVHCSNRKVSLKKLNDIEDRVVLVTAGPGMGKSTLLTQLSIKTKEVNPEIWIVRINLLKYVRRLRKWKKEKTAINLRDTLEFMCQVMLREKLGEENTVEITLEEKDNGVYLKQCTADPLTEFELNLFLNFYRERDIIFLIDGFDEIGPHYTDVVIALLKTVSNNPRKHRMWITSRSYNQVKTDLETEFGLLSYEMEGLSYKEMEEYLQKFWELNLRIEEFNKEQRDNVGKLCYHVVSVKITKNEELIDWILHQITKNAALYASYKMDNKEWHESVSDKMRFNVAGKDPPPPPWFCCQCCYCVGSHHNNDADSSSSSNTRCHMNPLIMYLAAVDIVHNIKYEYKMPFVKNSNIIRDVYAIFLKSIFKRQYQEKNKMEIYNPDVIDDYEEKFESSMLQLKKLAHYAVFNEFSHRLYTDEDLKEINEFIKVFKEGKKTNNFIESVEDGIPIFMHKTLAEYLAVEHISDRLKDEENCNKLKYFEMMFSEYDFFDNIRLHFDKKLLTDETLVRALENNKDVILNWLLSIEQTNSDEVYKCICGYLAENIQLVFERIIVYGLKNTALHCSEREKLSQLSEKIWQ